MQDQQYAHPLRIPMGCGEPEPGNLNDTFGLVKSFKKMISDICLSGISTTGLFLNADVGFDTEDFRSCCFYDDIVGNIDQNKRNRLNKDYLFNEMLYSFRFVVESTNAWMDSFITVLLHKL